MPFGPLVTVPLPTTVTVSFTVAESALDEAPADARATTARVARAANDFARMDRSYERALGV